MRLLVSLVHLSVLPLAVNVLQLFVKNMHHIYCPVMCSCCGCAATEGSGVQCLRLVLQEGNAICFISQSCALCALYAAAVDALQLKAVEGLRLALQEGNAAAVAAAAEGAAQPGKAVWAQQVSRCVFCASFLLLFWCGLVAAAVSVRELGLHQKRCESKQSHFCPLYRRSCMH